MLLKFANYHKKSQILFLYMVMKNMISFIYQDKTIFHSPVKCESCIHHNNTMYQAIRENNLLHCVKCMLQNNCIMYLYGVLYQSLYSTCIFVIEEYICIYITISADIPSLSKEKCTLVLLFMLMWFHTTSFYFYSVRRVITLLCLVPSLLQFALSLI